MKKIINFIKDLFAEPKCMFCGENKKNIGMGGLSNESLYVCINKTINKKMYQVY